MMNNQGFTGGDDVTCDVVTDVTGVLEPLREKVRAVLDAIDADENLAGGLLSRSTLIAASKLRHELAAFDRQLATIETLSPPQQERSASELISSI